MEGKVLIKAEPKSSSDVAYHDLHLSSALAAVCKVNTVDHDNRRGTFLLNGPLSECLKNTLQELFINNLSEYCEYFDSKAKCCA